MLGACATLAVAGGARLLDAVTVHGAARDVAALFAVARDRAMASGQRSAVRLDVAHQRVIVHAGSDTVARLDLGTARAVRLTATRDSMAYLTNGLGYGAANLRITLSRGAAEDTITVSRLGRVAR